MNAKDKNQYFDSESGSNDLALVAVCNPVRFSAVLGMFGHRHKGVTYADNGRAKTRKSGDDFAKMRESRDLLANTTNDYNGTATVFPQSFA